MKKRLKAIEKRARALGLDVEINLSRGKKDREIDYISFHYKYPSPSYQITPIANFAINDRGCEAAEFILSLYEDGPKLFINAEGNDCSQGCCLQNPSSILPHEHCYTGWDNDGEPCPGSGVYKLIFVRKLGEGACYSRGVGIDDI